MKIRLVILPPLRVSRWAGKLAKQITAKRQGQFVVDGRHFFHHITLFDVRINKAVFKFAVGLINKHLAHGKPFKLKVKGMWVNKNGYLVLNIVRSTKLSIFRMKLMSLIHKSRYGEVKTRYPGKKFDPHITLTKYPNQKMAQQIVRGIKTKNLLFAPRGIAFGMKDQYGQIYKIFKTIKLKK